MPIRAFISCHFPADATVEKICEMLKPDVEPYVSRDVKFGTLPHKIRERIAASDCLIVILTEVGDSAFVQNEIGIAFALGKPIFAIYDDQRDVTGIQPYISSYSKYSRENIAGISNDIISFKTEIVAELESRELGGPPEERLDRMNKNGIVGIYPDRSTAFRVFSPVWEREHDIKIVASSTEGFRRGIGIDARELLRAKLDKGAEATTIQILLTHSSFANYREAQEREIKGYIVNQIMATEAMLRELREQTQAGDRLQWRFFKGAPTCFTIMAGNWMLLNPYLYMQPAYFNFSMIVRNTESPFDVYSRYKQYHFQRAWDDVDLTTSDSGLELDSTRRISGTTE